MTDRYKEGYNQANRDWEKKIQEEINKIENSDAVGISDVYDIKCSFAKSILQDILKKG